MKTVHAALVRSAGGWIGSERFDIQARPPESGKPDNPAMTRALANGAPSIFAALQEQLGLRLDSQRGPVEFVVVDSIERPTPE